MRLFYRIHAKKGTIIMKLIHLSDLHLGKRVNNFPMLEDQKYILQQILDIITQQHPDAVLIAGDIYDRSVPPADAVTVFDNLLVEISKTGCPVFIISGNHDSAERLAFACRLMQASKIYISPVYRGDIQPVTLTDEYGAVDFYLLPFIKPAHVRQCFPDEQIETYTDAVACAIRHMPVRSDRRNVLITHQFVTGAVTCDSEELSIGGSDNVDSSVFDGFDYVALGHLHGPQKVGKEHIRYAGTPLKYSFSEAHHKKSVTIVELNEKSNLEIRTIPLTPLHDMVEWAGSYDDFRHMRFPFPWDAYLHVILTDEGADIPNAARSLREKYPNLMHLDYQKHQIANALPRQGISLEKQQHPLELFAEFYEQQVHSAISEEQAAYLSHIIAEVWEGQL